MVFEVKCDIDGAGNLGRRNRTSVVEWASPDDVMLNSSTLIRAVGLHGNRCRSVPGASQSPCSSLFLGVAQC